MKGLRHFVNFSLLFLAGLFILLPFFIARVDVDEDVLGDIAQRDFYKKINISSKDIMIRNLIREKDKERDFITFLNHSGTSSYLSLYEIANLTDMQQHYIIYPGKEALGELSGRKLILKLDDTKEIVIFNGDQHVFGDPKLEFELIKVQKLIWLLKTIKRINPKLPSRLT